MHYQRSRKDWWTGRGLGGEEIRGSVGGKLTLHIRLWYGVGDQIHSSGLGREVSFGDINCWHIDGTQSHETS